jgi:hypothetical protein
VTFPSSARGRGARARVRGCGIGLACLSLSQPTRTGCERPDGQGRGLTLVLASMRGNAAPTRAARSRVGYAQRMSSRPSAVVLDHLLVVDAGTETRADPSLVDTHHEHIQIDNDLPIYPINAVNQVRPSLE